MTKNRGFSLLAVAAIAVTLIATDDAEARFRRGGSCGSWGGSSFGSWGGGSWGSRGSWGGSHRSYGSWGGRAYQSDGCACNGNNAGNHHDQGELRESNYRGPQMNGRDQATKAPRDNASSDRPSLRGSDARDSHPAISPSSDPSNAANSAGQAGRGASRDDARPNRPSSQNGASNSEESPNQSGGPEIQNPENKRDF
jgi:hypothetical protein